MRCLIAEDDFICRKILKEFLSPYFDVDIAINGIEALEAFKLASAENRPYSLICMDILMPNLDGSEALRQIRDYEKNLGVSQAAECVVLTITSQDDPKTVFESLYKNGATGYIVKPISRSKLLEELRKKKLIS